jgi:hypothetical protein
LRARLSALAAAITWIKTKNPASDAVRREREEEWR